jgi:molecular chaperone GrpE (heat shock protein)
MKDAFEVVESGSNGPTRMEAILDVCRSRWELENRTAALEGEISEQTAVARELREHAEETDRRQRELLRGIAKIVDDCDDILQVEGLRLSDADPEDPVHRQVRRWYQRIEQMRAGLMARLTDYGVTARNPVGLPSPELDTVHGVIETDAIPAGEIVKVLRSGLLWNGSVLRCSLVVVAAPCDSPDGRP